MKSLAIILGIVVSLSAHADGGSGTAHENSLSRGAKPSLIAPTVAAVSLAAQALSPTTYLLSVAALKGAATAAAAITAAAATTPNASSSALTPYDMKLPPTPSTPPATTAATPATPPTTPPDGGQAKQDAGAQQDQGQGQGNGNQAPQNNIFVIDQKNEKDEPKALTTAQRAAAITAKLKSNNPLEVKQAKIELTQLQLDAEIDPRGIGADLQKYEKINGSVDGLPKPGDTASTPAGAEKPKT